MLAHPCQLPPATGPRLPAAIVAVNSCGTFLAEPDGRVERLPRHWLNRHDGGTGRTYGAKLQVRFDHRRLELWHEGRRVWRASRVYKDYGGDISFGPRGLLAFSTYKRGVFLAHARGHEDLVLRGRGLYTRGFTPRGDLVVVLPGARIRLLDATGHIVERIRYRARNGLAFDDRTGRLTWMTSRQRVAELVDRHFSFGGRIVTDGWLQVFPDGLLGFGDEHSVLLAHRDGRIVASAWLRRGTIDSGFVPSPDGRQIAFRVRYGGLRVGAPITVFVLRAGDRFARPILHHRVAHLHCASGAGFDWHGRFLLYKPIDATQALIDTRSGARIDLERLARALPPPRGSRTHTARFYWLSDVA